MFLTEVGKPYTRFRYDAQRSSSDAAPVRIGRVVVPMLRHSGHRFCPVAGVENTLFVQCCTGGGRRCGAVSGDNQCHRCKATLLNRGPQYVSCGRRTNDSSSLWTENDRGVADIQTPQAACASASAVRHLHPLLRTRGAQWRCSGRSRPGSPRSARQRQPARPPWLHGLSRPWRSRSLPSHVDWLASLAACLLRNSSSSMLRQLGSNRASPEHGILVVRAIFCVIER
jgi:hypothetical protein